MIFDATTANRIACGRKVQHRIPRLDHTESRGEALVIVRTPDGEVEERPVASFAKATDPIDRTMPITIMVSNPELGYERKNPNQPKKEGKVICRVRLAGVREGFLHEATDQDAHKEGHQDLEEFIGSWRARHNNQGPGVPGAVVEVPVWILDFVRNDQHRPRFLSRASDVNRGYTESPVQAIEEAGEAVEDEWLERFAMDSSQDKAARLGRLERRMKERALEDRLVEVREAARRGGVDVTRQLAAIERRVSAAESIVKKYGKAA